jgi:hypoxanthine phosphoribosyltransferase
MMGSPERPMRHEILTWDDVDKLIDVLVPQLRGVGGFTGMVMITRGGLIPGGMLAEILKIQHVLTASVDFPATAETRTALMAWPEFLQFPDERLVSGRRILIVDDVWGSGRTSIAVRERLISAHAEAFNCVLHFNPYRSLFSKQKPDFYAAVTDAYIVYPWEIDRGLRGLDIPTPIVG